ncbi:MAG: glycosyltransferase family 4 protein [Coriobacteriales bacterium]|jgi:glycosyltransferase involved in cell wall biosynthesis|nr:glycosyltransferase family 4 protein [Coriobacteriales bacterium]
MRVLLINHFPLEGSGSGTYTRDVAQFLVKRGHEVCVIFPENKTPEPMPGVQLCPVYFDGNDAAGEALPYNFPCFTTHPRSTTTFADLSQQQMDEYLAAFDRTARRVMEDFCPDIIHAQHIWILAYLGAHYNVPCVITAHGTDLMGYEKWPQLRHYADEAVDACDSIITISQDNYRATLEVFPQAKSKAQIVRNGYNNDIFYPEPLDRAALLAQYGLLYNGEKFILFAGKLTEFKGVDVFLHAVQKYEESKPGGFITVIAGMGQEGDNLKALAEELGLENTHFVGHQNQQQLRKLYSTADVFVIPSRYEPFGLVALEAMACGLPVVATNVGGLVDFVTDEVGALVPPLDPDALMSAVLEVLEATQRDATRKTNVARYALDRFSMTNYASQLEAIYQSLLDDAATA